MRPHTPSNALCLLALAMMATSCRSMGETPPPPPLAPPSARVTTEAPAPAPIPAPPVVEDPLVSIRALLAQGDYEGAAVEAGDAVTAAGPDDARAATASLLKGRAERLLAADAAARGDGTSAELNLADALSTLEAARNRSPADLELLHEHALALRDAYRFEEAAALLRQLLPVEGRANGEAYYDLAYCVAYGGDFEQGLALFRDAVWVLGPEPRILVNVAICEDRLGRRDDALATLAELFALEAAAGRARGADGRRALEKIWEFTVGRGDYDAGRAALSALAAAHPDEPSPPYMLGNLLAFLKEHVAAADAFARAAVAGGGLPAAHPRQARALVRAGNADGAEAATREALRLAPDDGETLPALLDVARLRLRAGNAVAARALLEAGAAVLSEEPSLERALGDAAVAAGDRAGAHAAYARASSYDPFDGAAEAHRERAALALRREGAAAGEEPAPPPPSAEGLDPVRPARLLLDFDGSRVTVRGGVGGEALRIPGVPAVSVRTPAAAARLEFFPEADLSTTSEILLALRTGGGNAGIRIGIVDGYDEAGGVRSRWPATGPAAVIGPERVLLAVPVADIAGVVPSRALPPLLHRVRTLLVQVEPAEGNATPDVFLEEVRFVDPAGGGDRIVADFTGAPADEVLVGWEGTSVPFLRSLFSPEQVDSFELPGTTPVARHIQRDAFDPTHVGGGTGAMRLHHGETGNAGASAMRVVFRPPAAVRRHPAITFLARGLKGGERLRVRLVDAQENEAASTPGQRLPDAVFPRTDAADGVLVLEPRWRRYRIPRDSYPDVDLGALAALVFEFGDDIGNATGTVVLLDDIGCE